MLSSLAGQLPPAAPVDRQATRQSPSKESIVTNDPSSAFVPAPVKATIPHSIVEQIDVRVGRILAVDDVANSQKLVKLRVGFGDHERTILAGMKAERGVDIQKIVGQQALFVVNLEPRKMAGEMSEGMIFDLGYPDGILPALAQPERELPEGTRAG
jgi:tRNA-binding protein